MAAFTMVFLLFFLNSGRSNADAYPVASPGQDAAKLMKQRKELLTELVQVGIALESKPINCGSVARIFAVLRKSEPLPTCPKAKEQYERMLRLEKSLLNTCQGSKARGLLEKFSTDDDWYRKMFDNLFCRINRHLGIINF